MKNYSYRKTRLTENDIEKLHNQINELPNKMNDLKDNISNTITQCMFHAAETMKSYPKDQCELDLILYLAYIKPYCRSSSFLDE